MTLLDLNVSHSPSASFTAGASEAKFHQHKCLHSAKLVEFTKFMFSSDLVQPQVDGKTGTKTESDA